MVSASRAREAAAAAVLAAAAAVEADAGEEGGSVIVHEILAVALALSAVQVRYRDVGIALPVLMQLLMFVSPIIYPLSVVPASWRPWYLLNPLAGIVSSFRDVLLRQTAPDPYPLAMACLVIAIVLPASFMFFKHVEATMADVI